MTKKMLIDTSTTDETRVTIIEDGNLEEFDYEHQNKVPLKGNIYLAKITRVEPSLQAAFVDYGELRHGFLSFNEIHPDYFKVPVDDLKELDENGTETDDAESFDDVKSDDDEHEQDVIDIDAEEDLIAETHKIHIDLKKRYKIQEVIKKGQVMLVQVVKEERGNKGAALTTYLSLASRYCVLMPNTSRTGGISRKISDVKDRNRLKDIVSKLDLPEGMGLILRTAGSRRTKLEVNRDFGYVCNLWDTIRKSTLNSTAPSLIHQEGNLLKRAIRDMYDKDIDEIIVDGKEGHDACKKVMKEFIPSHVKKIRLHNEELKKDEVATHLFIAHGVEAQIKSIHSNIVKMKSGAFLVLNQTEALVAIDVNSGRSTRERYIEETALNTNLEAAVEVAKQLKLRDLAGLVVIDFIDMEEKRNIHIVENKLKEALSNDRARIKVGRISHFGLLEMSRQRLRTSLVESVNQKCPVCDGGGFIQSYELMAQSLMRSIETEGFENGQGHIEVSASQQLALYVLNNNRNALQQLESKYNISISIKINEDSHKKYAVTRVGAGNNEHSKQSTHNHNKRKNKQNRKNNNYRKNRYGKNNQNNQNQMSENNKNDNGNDTNQADVEKNDVKENNVKQASKKSTAKKQNRKRSENKAEVEVKTEVKAESKTEVETKAKKATTKKSVAKKTKAKKTATKTSTAKVTKQPMQEKRVEEKSNSEQNAKQAEDKKDKKSGWWQKVF